MSCTCGGIEKVVRLGSDPKCPFHGESEHDRLKNKVTELKAENDRLHFMLRNDFLSNKMTSLQKEIDSLREENARYRVALERIENECSRHDTSAWTIASDALEGTKE